MTVVTCAGCGATYECTPERDYFRATTTTDGLCWDCLLAGRGFPAQVEPPYLRAGGEE